MKAYTKAERVTQRKRQRKQRAIIMMTLGSALLLVVSALLFNQFKPQPKAGIEVSGAPRLRVDTDYIDMGDVKLEKVVRATFKLTNVGDEPLKITKEPYIEVLEGC